jgi:hypothetical protein
MARRPEIKRNVLTREELNELERKLQLLSPYSVEAHYCEQWQKREIRPDVLPKPRLMQQLVALWQTLWKWRGKCLSQRPLRPFPDTETSGHKSPFTHHVNHVLRLATSHCASVSYRAAHG